MNSSQELIEIYFPFIWMVGKKRQNCLTFSFSLLICDLKLSISYWNNDYNCLVICHLENDKFHFEFSLLTKLAHSTVQTMPIVTFYYPSLMLQKINQCEPNWTIIFKRNETNFLLIIEWSLRISKGKGFITIYCWLRLDNKDSQSTPVTFRTKSRLIKQ